MFFRNVIFFRFPASHDFSLLDEGLAEFALKPIGPQELRARGFVPPLGRDTEALAHRVGNCVWITLGGEDRVLPSAAVNEAVAKKTAEIEKNEGRRVGGRQRKRIKEEIVLDMIPRSFTRPTRTDAYLNIDAGWLAVDTSSDKTAEAVVSAIRQALGSFPALHVEPQESVQVRLSDWLNRGGTGDSSLNLGEECELRDRAEKGATVRLQHQELESDEVRAHLEAGKVVSRLALLHRDHLSFVLDESLRIRKLKFLDGALETIADLPTESRLQELDAQFALAAGELSLLFAMLDRKFLLTVPEALFKQPELAAA